MYCRYRAEAEERWNWTLAGVPDALTPEMEKAQREKEKEKKKRAKSKKVEHKAAEEGKASSAGDAPVSFAGVKKNNLSAPSQESRVQDKRSVAPAEKIGADRFTCANCGNSLFGKTSFDVFDRRCCDADCAAKYKRKVLSAAAESRLKKAESVPAVNPASVFKSSEKVDSIISPSSVNGILSCWVLLLLSSLHLLALY